ncbi:DEAD/DEAH box helicase [Thiofilum flexile]|uniref:DEAD/DEAH box helicase n=1 Tax=Thiofilum flexile TaxID=125627 RepID=UPI00036E7E1F|nr:DEAD/DEAH box helicase [Thiofilum flexile]
MLKPEHIRLLKLAGLPPEGILVSYDLNSIRRGANYFQEGRVQLKRHASTEDSIAIESSVTGNNPYETHTLIDRNTYNVRNTCSCSTGEQCKHGVASVLEYAQAVAHQSVMAVARSNSANEVQRWLNDLEQTTPQDDPNLKESLLSASDIIYLLSNGAKQRRLTVEPRRANQLKRGGYGQHYRIEYSTLLSRWARPSFRFSEMDRDILQMIVPRDHVQAQPIELTGQLGRIALDLMTQTERLFWQSTDHPPLKRGTPRHARLEWTKNGKNSRITLVVEPEITDFFQLDQLFYVDTQHSTYGLLEHPTLSINQLLHLLKAPPIPDLEAERVSQKILQLIPQGDVPLPASKVQSNIIDVPAQEPIADVILRAVQLPELNKTVHVASLRFDYGGHLVQPEAMAKITIVNKDQQRYRIHHHLTAEDALTNTLFELGFDLPDAWFESLDLYDLVMNHDNPQQAATQWERLLQVHIPELTQTGAWRFTIDESFVLRFDNVEHWSAEVHDSAPHNAWFDISMGFEIDGQRIDLLPLLLELLEQSPNPLALKQKLQDEPYLLVPIHDYHWVKLESKRLITIFDTLIELFDYNALGTDGRLRLHKLQSAAFSELLNSPLLQWSGAEAIQQLATRLSDFSGITPVPPPEGLQATLRPYQQQGLNWLQFLREYQLNGILADDMGLGKTLQALAHLLIEQQRLPDAPPSLIVAPTSLMSNWRREAERFTPQLKVLVLHGSERHQHFETLKNYDLILTTYPLIVRDEALYAEYNFHYLILDEAQTIKNAKSKTSQAIFSLKAQHRLCLTGTPMENHLSELWSLFHFLMPGFLGSHDQFGRLFRTPIEKHQDLARQHQLRQRIQPFMLRRSKALVASELPPKTEIIRTVALEGKQRDLYETVRLAMDQKVRDEINQKGLARSHIMLLDALLKLRQICCDPRLIKLEQAQNIIQSAKLELLMTLLPEMVEEGRKVLLFSQFTSMLSLIETELVNANIRFTKLTGQTRRREEVINEFQEGDASVFLISLKAGGTGLNLTAADTVIHYDPWWNPAAENQATDRAYRLGQDKPVFVYKLITEETVEEKILRLQQRKQALADGIYSGKESESNDLSADDLLDLLKPLGE